MYHYTMCGLDYVWLENGYTLEQTPYGDGVVIDNGDQLDQAIAQAIVSGDSAMTGAELRFLRQLLGLSQRDLGGLLGSSDQTIARWEKSAGPMPRAEDMLMRVIYASHANGNESVRGVVKRLNFMDRVKHDRIVLAETQGHWTIDPKAADALEA